MNSNSWSGYDYKYDEKIECSMLLTITDRFGPEEFKATLTIASQRPVYNSTYNTVLFNTIDRDVEFKYIENEPLDFYENSFLKKGNEEDARFFKAYAGNLNLIASCLEGFPKVLIDYFQEIGNYNLLCNYAKKYFADRLIRKKDLTENSSKNFEKPADQLKMY